MKAVQDKIDYHETATWDPDDDDFGDLVGTRPNISESHSGISTRVPLCIAHSPAPPRRAAPRPPRGPQEFLARFDAPAASPAPGTRGSDSAIFALRAYALYDAQLTLRFLRSLLPQAVLNRLRGD